MSKRKSPKKNLKKGSPAPGPFSIPKIYVCVALLSFILVVASCLLALESPATIIISPSPTPSPTVTASPTQTSSTPPPLPRSPSAATDRREISRGDQTKKQLIFTFDGGSGDGSTKEILETLAKHKVKGTFFFTGGWMKENPAWVKKIVAEGHEIFNHSYSHPYFTKITDTQIAEELKKMDDLLFELAGVRTQPYYRAPYGDRDARVNDAAFAAGYQHIYWSVDSLDWREGETTETIWNRVMPNIHNGAIILMHVGNPVTGHVLDRMFTTLEGQGYKLVSLTQGL